MVVGYRGLARKDGAGTGDLVEGVDGERRGPVRGRQQVAPDPEGGAGADLGLGIHTMSPYDLLREGQIAGDRLRGPLHPRRTLDRFRKLPATDGDDAPRAPDLFLLGRERDRLVGAAAGLVGEAPGQGVEAEAVPFLRILDRLAALDHVQAQVESVAPEDVADVRAADDDQLQAGFLGDCLQSRRAHLPGRADGEAIPRHQESLAAMDPGAKVWHQVAEGADLPALVEAVQALRDAVRRRRDLIGVDRIELAPGDLGIPEDQRLAADAAAVGLRLGR